MVPVNARALAGDGFTCGGHLITDRLLRRDIAEPSNSR